MELIDRFDSKFWIAGDAKTTAGMRCDKRYLYFSTSFSTMQK